jgi:hypothetical protein
MVVVHAHENRDPSRHTIAANTKTKIDRSNNQGAYCLRRCFNNAKRIGGAFLLASLGFAQIDSAALAQTVQEVRIRWDAYILGSPAPQVNPDRAIASNVLTLLERRSVSGHVPRQRYPQLSSNHIVVLARDANGQIADLQIMQDPRILRAELPGPTGELTGQVLHHAQMELLIVLNDAQKPRVIELYHPRWTGLDYVLEIIGSVSLN